MLVGTPWVLIGVFGLGLAAFLTLSVVFLVQKDQFKKEVDGTRDKFQRIEQQWDTISQNANNSNAATVADVEFFPNEDTWSSYRLPRNMWPLSYDLSIRVDTPHFTYYGIVIIQVKVLETTNRIILHSDRLNITSITIINTCSKFVPVYKELDLTRQFLILYANEYFEKDGIIQLTINFWCYLLLGGKGFYAATYLNSNNERKKIATTKFEPTYARKAFPCFDEPEMKATFDIKIKYRDIDNYHALSNMNSLGVTHDNGWATNQFATTVPMSTYLVCFIVSDYGYKETKIDPKGIGEPFHLRVYAQIEQLHLLELSLDAGKQTLEYYIQYFQVPFPLPKMAMISIPDFPTGAMENWGLITYREEYLLYASLNTSSTGMKHRVASVIAHEYAHMWFGNLVTLKWWNDLWLNEGFASWFQIKAVDATYPKFRMHEQFIVDVFQRIIYYDDALKTTPVVKPVEAPEEIKSRFSSVTYDKGAVLVRMMEDFVGEDNFQRAATSYLNKYKYNNSETKDFLLELANLNLDFDVYKVMRTWTEQTGVPLVHVEKISDTKYNLTQYRFFKLDANYDGIYDDSPFGYTWSIPITYITSATKEVQRTWFHYNMKSVIIELPSTVDWIKFNVNVMGYYRVNYEKELWEAIIKILLQSPDALSTGDRGHLLDDAFVLAEAKHLSYEITLDLCKYLEKETEYVPWISALPNLKILTNKIIGTEAYSDFQSFIQKLIKNAYDSVGWSVSDDDDELKKLLRVEILKAACLHGLESCLTDAAKEFDRVLENPDDPVHEDLLGALYSFGAKKLTDTKKWEKLLDLYVATDDEKQKGALIVALGSVEDLALMSRFIDVAWNESIVPSEAYFKCLTAISLSPFGNSVVWKYYRENLPILEERFDDDAGLTGFVGSVSTYFNTHAQLEEMKEFFNKNPNAAGREETRQFILGNIKDQIDWLEDNLEGIQNWLKSNA